LPPSTIVPVNFLSSQTTLSKAWNGSVSLLGLRHTVTANVFSRHQTSQAISTSTVGAGDFSTSSSIKQNGLGLISNWRLTPFTAWNTVLNLTYNEFPDVRRDDTQYFFMAGFSQQLSPRMSGALNYRRQHNNSSTSSASYTENSVVAQVLMRF